MKKLLIATLLFIFVGSLPAQRVYAQLLEIPQESTLSATTSSEVSTLSSETLLPEIPVPIRASNITENTGETADRLEQTLLAADIGPVQPLNVIQHAIRRALSRDISASTIAFVLLFPLVASLIAFARHVVGLSGLSMYAPAALAVALLSLGIFQGSILFAGILILATLGKWILHRFKLPYLPRTAMILWIVSFGMFGLLIASTYVPFFSLSVVNVFALLILILLSENFLEIQGSVSASIALQRVLETFVLGLLCALVLGSEIIQTAAVLYPEATLLVIAAINIVIGRYLGLRFTELIRFQSIMETEE